MVIGGKAPKFSLVGHDGRKYGPGSFGRKKMVLGFFPPRPDGAAAFFLKELGGGLGAFFSGGMVPVGVCPAPPEELSQLRGKLELPFILLSDTNGELAKTYGLLEEADEEGSTLRPSVVLLSEDTSLLAVLTDLPKEAGARPELLDLITGAAAGGTGRG